MYHMMKRAHDKSRGMNNFNTPPQHANRPRLTWCCSKMGRGRGFVKGLLVLDIWESKKILEWTWEQIKWKWISMCFVRLCEIPLEASTIAPSLSDWIEIDERRSMESWMKLFLSHIPSWSVRVMAMYSASVVERAMHICFFADQEISPPAKNQQ